MPLLPCYVDRQSALYGGKDNPAFLEFDRIYKETGSDQLRSVCIEVFKLPLTHPVRAAFSIVANHAAERKEVNSFDAAILHVMKEPIMVWRSIKKIDSGVFYILDPIHRMFAQTDADVPCSELHSPFGSTYIELVDNTLIKIRDFDTGRMIDVTGCFIQIEEEHQEDEWAEFSYRDTVIPKKLVGRQMILHFVAIIDGNIGNVANFSFRLHLDSGMLSESIEHAITEYFAQPEKRWPREDKDELKEMINVPINFLLYLTTEKPDAQFCDPIVEFDLQHRRLKQKKLKRLAPHRPNRVAYTVIGRKIRHEFLFSEVTNRSINMKFWVRGHWRNQAHGPKHVLRKLLWITPYPKGREFELKDQRYVVK